MELPYDLIFKLFDDSNEKRTLIGAPLGIPGDRQRAKKSGFPETAFSHIDRHLRDMYDPNHVLSPDKLLEMIRLNDAITLAGHMPGDEWKEKRQALLKMVLPHIARPPPRKSMLDPGAWALELIDEEGAITCPLRYRTIGVCGNEAIADEIIKRLSKQSITANHKRFSDPLRKTFSEYYDGLPVITTSMIEKTLADYGEAPTKLAIYGLRTRLHYIFRENVCGKAREELLHLLEEEFSEIFGPTIFIDILFKQLGNQEIVVISDVRTEKEKQTIRDRNGIVFVGSDIGLIMAMLS